MAHEEYHRARNAYFARLFWVMVIATFAVVRQVVLGEWAAPAWIVVLMLLTVWLGPSLFHETHHERGVMTALLFVQGWGVWWHGEELYAVMMVALSLLVVWWGHFDDLGVKWPGRPVMIKAGRRGK